MITHAATTYRRNEIQGRYRRFSAMALELLEPAGARTSNKYENTCFVGWLPGPSWASKSALEGNKLKHAKRIFL